MAKPRTMSEKLKALRVELAETKHELNRVTLQSNRVLASKESAFCRIKGLENDVRLSVAECMNAEERAFKYKREVLVQKDKAAHRTKRKAREAVHCALF